MKAKIQKPPAEAEKEIHRAIAESAEQHGLKYTVELGLQSPGLPLKGAYKPKIYVQSGRLKLDAALCDRNPQRAADRWVRNEMEQMATEWYAIYPDLVTVLTALYPDLPIDYSRINGWTLRSLFERYCKLASCRNLTTEASIYDMVNTAVQLRNSIKEENSGKKEG